MPVKVYFGQEIHRFTKLPANLKALHQTITSAFTLQLPPTWNICYTDSEGDSITLAHEEDYTELLETELKEPSSMVKFYIISVQDVNSSLLDNENKVDRKESYEVIGDEARAQLEACKTQKASEEEEKLLEDEAQFHELPSQNNREETANADQKAYKLGQQIQEVNPRAHPQPQDEGNSASSFPCKKKRIQREERKDLTEDQQKALQTMNLYKSMKKLLKAGDIPELKEYREQLEKIAPELKPALASLFEITFETKDRRKMKEANKLVKQQIIEFYCSQDDMKACRESRNGGKSQRDSTKEERKIGECEGLKAQNEQQLNAFKPLDDFKGMINAYKKGCKQKLNDYRQNFEKDPELKPIIDELFKSLYEQNEQKTIRDAIESAKFQIKQHYGLKRRERGLRQSRHCNSAQKGDEEENEFNGEKSGQEGLSEQKIRLFENMATYKNLMNAYRKGDAVQVSEYCMKLEEEVPELKPILIKISQAISEGGDKKKIEMTIKEVRIQLKKQFCLDGQGNLFSQYRFWNKANEKK